MANVSELQKELSKGSISLCNLAKLLNGVDNCYDCEHFGGFDSDGVAICEVNAHAQEVLCKAHCSVNGIDEDLYSTTPPANLTALKTCVSALRIRSRQTKQNGREPIIGQIKEQTDGKEKKA